jgi:hypothetical protein
MVQFQPEQEMHVSFWALLAQGHLYLTELMRKKDFPISIKNYFNNFIKGETPILWKK